MLPIGCFVCLQVFDPAVAKKEGDDLNASFVLDAFKDVPPFVEHDLLKGMSEEVHKYAKAAEKFECTAEKSDLKEYTKQVLKFWAEHHEQFPTWARAARIVFSLSPNSAACERVFSLLKNFFGVQQHSSLADQIQNALMLAYNKRAIG